MAIDFVQERTKSPKQDTEPVQPRVSSGAMPALCSRSRRSQPAAQRVRDARPRLPNDQPRHPRARAPRETRTVGHLVAAEVCTTSVKRMVSASLLRAPDRARALEMSNAAGHDARGRPAAHARLIRARQVADKAMASRETAGRGRLSGFADLPRKIEGCGVVELLLIFSDSFDILSEDAPVPQPKY